MPNMFFKNDFAKKNLTEKMNTFERKDMNINFRRLVVSLKFNRTTRGKILKQFLTLRRNMTQYDANQFHKE